LNGGKKRSAKTSPRQAKVGLLRSPLEKPLYPDKAQISVEVILAEPLHDAGIRRLLQIQKSVEILLDHNVAKIHRDGANEAQLFFTPQLLGDVPHSMLERMIAADFVTCSATASMNRIKIRGNRMPVLAERAYNNVCLNEPSVAQDTLG
jgi:hypothetical protein